MGTKLGGFAAGRKWAVCTVCIACALMPALARAQQTPPSDADTTISEAQEHFRMGVTLYRQGNFREALDEFNRALALDPDYEEAKQFRDDAEEQLNLSAVGVSPTERPSFETLEPETIAPPEESPQLSPEEYKIQRVRELLDLADRYLDYQFYKEAVDYYEQVLLIAPDNNHAQKGLHDATLGLYDERIKENQTQLQEQSARIRVNTEEMKLLPEGADALGVKNPRIEVPRVEERTQETEQRTRIDEVLDNPVGVVFEDIHLRDILDFITDTYEVNIMVDSSVVAPPQEEQAAAAGPGQPPGRVQPGRAGAGIGPGGGGGGGGIAAFAAAQGQQQNQGQAQYVTDGMITYVNLKDISLRQALKAILRPLNLDFTVVQDSFIWISTPEKIRTQSFEDLETRFYELKNAGAETLFKIVVENQGGAGQTANVGGGGGGQGGGGGGFGGGGAGGGGAGGGGFGGGGAGGGGGGFGGGGGGGLGGGGGGGFGGGGGAGGGGLGGGGGGQGGGQGGAFGNISDLFGTIDDTEVGEFPSPFNQGGGGGAGGLGGGGGGLGAAGGAGTGAFGAAGGAGGAGAQFSGGPGPGLGAAAGFSGESQALQIIRSLVPPVIEPVSRRLLSFMRYNLLTNQLVVHTTPSNHKKIAELLENLDKRPKQVAIEAKFLTVSVNDQKKTGFEWNLLASDLNGRARGPITQLNPTLAGTGTVRPPADISVDIDGDGEPETFPADLNPRTGAVASPFDNTVSLLDLAAGVVNPGPPGSFRLVGSIFDNADGDQLSVAFEFLDSIGETELLSAPRVTTMNQKPAVIADVTQEYFLVGVQSSAQVVTTTGGATNAGTVINTFQSQIVQSFIFGFTLSVTPQIADSQVRLWLNPQVVNRQGEKTFEIQNNIGGATNTNSISFPTVRTQAVWTNVVVNDGDTLVLGGLVTDNTARDETKFPYLADIPVIGFFFRGKSHTTQQSSLLIFVTPTIIDPSGARAFEPSV